MNDLATAMPESPPRPALPGSVGEQLGLPTNSARLLAARLQEGAAPAEALRSAGAPEPLARFVESAAPREAGLALAFAASAFARLQERRRFLRSLAAYPLLLAAAAPVVAGLVAWGLRPAMALPAGSTGPYPLRLPPLPVAAFALCAVGVACLLFLAFALWGSGPRFPFARERSSHEKAALLAGALAAVKGGCDLGGALRAAAHLVSDPRLAAAAIELGASLDRGAPEGGDAALGELGAALFRATAAKGAGASTLEALAELEEARAESERPGLALKAELLALAFGGLAILGAGIAVAQVYSGSLG